MTSPLRCLRSSVLSALASLAILATVATGASAETPFALDTGHGSPQYSEVVKTSLYVPMSDGVRLAVDLYMPTPLDAGENVPAIVQITRYWRAMELIGPLESRQGLDREASFFARRGYAYLKVDARGTGASFGTRPGPLAEREVQDGCDLVRWMTEQPWSNGRVGALGVSYAGSTTALLATCKDPAVRIVIPRFNEFDVYTDIAYPGGIFHEAFVRTWAAGNDALDRNRTPKALFGLSGKVAVKGVAPVDGPDGPRLLEEAVKEHAANANVAALAGEAEFRDRKRKTGGPGEDDTISIDQFSLHSRMQDLEDSPTALYLWGSWMDAATAQAVLAQVVNLDRPLRAVIGPWNHGADHHASPYLPAETAVAPGGAEQLMDFLHSFEPLLKDDGSSEVAFEGSPRLRYYTLGEERWKETETWPPEGFEPSRWYFLEGRELEQGPEQGPAKVMSSGSSPAAVPPRSFDRYPVDFTATTGTTNRWYTQHGDTDVDYGDRRKADEKLLTYTSPPLEHALEVTGYPVATLGLSTTATDGAVFVYLEDVAPDGRVRYVTEGQLRLAARHLDPQPPYRLPHPQPSFREADARPMEPGKVETVTIPLLPTSVVFGKGHRLRIAIAGQDADSFRRIPAATESEAVTFAIARGPGASFVTLPTKPREDSALPPELNLALYGGLYQLPSGGSLRVTVDGPFLRLGAEDQIGADLLVPPPGPAAAEARGLFNTRAQSLADALRGSDTKALAAWMEGKDSSAQLWKERKLFRKVQGLRVVGTSRWLGQPLTTVQLTGTPQKLLLLWNPASGKTERWGLSMSLPGDGRYLARSVERFEAFDPRAADTLRFEHEDGRPTALHLLGQRAVRQ